MAEQSTRLSGAAERSAIIRSELKAWEKKFAAANGGQKPGKDDVKRNLEIGKEISDCHGRNADMK